MGKAANVAANASCGGGGASDIRVAPYGLANRVAVASGGGGMGVGEPFKWSRTCGRCTIPSGAQPLWRWDSGSFRNCR